MSGFCAGCGARFDDDDRFCAKCGAPRRPGVQTAGPPADVPTAKPEDLPTKAFGPVLLGALLPVIGIGLFVAMGPGSCSESTEGSVVVAGARGNFTFTPTGCASMQPYGRFGANLHGDGPNDGAVYVTVDPMRGPAVDVEIPGSCRNANGTDCTVFSLPRDRCSAFETDVDFNGVTVNDVRLVEGHVRVDCTLEDGTTVRGTVTFDGC